MPWENNGGGGGRNPGGPWGQAPGGGGNGPRRPGNTPNLEDILNRGRDRFQGGIPGGRWALIGGALALLAFWGFNSIYTINPQEVGVELQFGRPKPERSEPGLHFLIWPIETVERVTITENQTVIGAPTGNQSSGNRGSAQDGLMLSGDQNIVDVRFSVLWSVANPIDFLFNVRDPDEMVRNAGESAMREVVGRRPAQDVFRDDRAGIQIEVQQITQTILDNYGLGVRVGQILIEQAAPPPEVADAFNDVQRAEQDEDRVQEEARSFANTTLGNARGEAARLREEAAAYRNQVVLEAQGQAARFTSIYNEYRNAPEITRRRLYLETMAAVLGGSQKILIEQGADGSGVVPYLPLPELRANATNQPASPTTGTSQ
jgi:modulator of FtsH protease HflK